MEDRILMKMPHICWALLVGCEAVWGQNPVNPTITVDFATPLKVASMSGFLHADISTPPSVITPLRPNLWRIGGYPFNDPARPTTAFDHASLYARRVMMVLSDLWGYPGPPSSQPANPFDDWTKWEAAVHKVAQANIGRDILWDVWNEPNFPSFWSGTQAQLFELYSRTFRILRQELGPDAVIGGPSLASYDKGYLTAFFDYCAANGCEVNFLSWHELDDLDPSITAIAGHLSDARASFLQNAKYAALKTSAIYVNEIVGPTNKHRPGAIVQYLYYLEKGGADGAAKSCWNDSQNNIECYNDTLDGLVTPGTFQPRAAWWVYRFYADGAATRVASTVSDPRVAGVASTGSGTQLTAQVLAGYHNSAGLGLPGAPNPAPPVTVTLSLQNVGRIPYFQGLSQAHLKVQRIPNTDEAPLAQPMVTDERDIAITSSPIQVQIPAFQPGEAYLVTLASASTKPYVSADAFTNSANYANTGVSPGEIITIFPANAGPPALAGAQLDASGKIARMIGNTRLLFDGIAAPMIYSLNGQISAVVPYEVAGQTSTQAQVEYNGVAAPAVTIPVLATLPGIFTANQSGRGQAAILNQDSTPNSATNPAARSSVMVLFATGEGQTKPAGIDGQLANYANLSDYPAPVLPVAVLVGGVQATILYAGAAPTFVAGAFQVNFQVPATAPQGNDIPLQLKVGSASSQIGVTVAIR